MTSHQQKIHSEISRSGTKSPDMMQWVKFFLAANHDLLWYDISSVTTRNEVACLYDGVVPVHVTSSQLTKLMWDLYGEYGKWVRNNPDLRAWKHWQPFNMAPDFWRITAPLEELLIPILEKFVKDVLALSTIPIVPIT
jgi:hypothetical protein